MKLYYSILGYRRVSFAVDVAADVLNLCMKYRYPYRDMKSDGERVSFVCTLFSASRLTSRASELGIEITNGGARGVPELFSKLFLHPGIVVGFFLACLLIFISDDYVWDVRVTGNERFSSSEIESALAKTGFSVGSPLKNFNPDRTELECLISNPDLAWISVNVKGNVAYVEVREKLVTESQIKDGKSANIVASHSGKVLELIAYNGVPTVKAGDEVREGELLISGVYGDKTPGLRVTRASGYVLARTVRVFSAEIPYSYERKVYDGEKKQEIFAFFFKNPIKVFGNSGNLGSTCVKIIEDEILGFFGADLPVVLRTETEREYTLELRQRSEQEARALALEGLEAQIRSQLGDAEILSRKNSFTVVNGVCRLECELVCLENIAKTVEFEADFKN